MSTRAILVPDTNVLLHAVPLSQISWREVAGVDEVELVLVPHVLHELDTKKYGTSEKLRKRALRVMSELDTWISPGTQSATIAVGVVLRVVPREPVLSPGLDPMVGDDRILASALELRADATASVVVVSGDIAMRFKAEALGLRVLKVPEQFRLTDEERKEPTKTPRVDAGFLHDEDAALTHSLATSAGLSAAHLLPEARRLLASSKSKPLHLPVILALDGEPNSSDYRRYISAIEHYDQRNAKVFTFVLGVANTGTAPADDVVVEFWLPDAVRYHDGEPPLPRVPRRRDYTPPIARNPPHGERTESFTFKRHDDGTAHAEIRVKRLMHSKRVGYSVWAELVDDTLSGFPIRARVLVAAPAVTAEMKLNLRIRRGPRS
jgi:hypothetical protein